MKAPQRFFLFFAVSFTLNCFAASFKDHSHPIVVDVANCKSIPSDSQTNIKKIVLSNITEEKWGQQLSPSSALTIDLSDGSSIEISLIDGTELTVANLENAYLERKATLTIQSARGPFKITGKSYLNITRDDVESMEELTFNGNFQQSEVVAFSGKVKCTTDL